VIKHLSKIFVFALVCHLHAQSVNGVPNQAVGVIPDSPLNTVSGSVNQIQNIANSLADTDLYTYSDGTIGRLAATGYSAYGPFAEDSTYYALFNPTKISASELLNLATKLVAAVDAHGVVPPTTGDVPGGINVLYYSGLDSNHAYTSGVGADMVGFDCYLHYLKTGTTVCYTSFVSALKTSQAYRPINGSTHLPTVVVGANEYIPGTLFEEQVRGSGDIASAAVLLAGYDYVMYQMATAAGDYTNAAFFSTNLAQVEASIQSVLVDPTTKLLIFATGQNSTNLDIWSSTMAVWLSQFLNTPLIPLTEQKAIGTYLHTNLAALSYSGFVRMSPTNWATQGILLSGGGSYTALPAGAYQEGFWCIGGPVAAALYLTNPLDIPAFLAKYRDQSSGSNNNNPTIEWYNQDGTIGAQGGHSPSMNNLISGASPAWAAAHLLGPTANNIANCGGGGGTAVNCGSANAGTIYVPGGTSTYTVNTTAVTPWSEFYYSFAIYGSFCGTPPSNIATMVQPYTSVVTPGTSFVITFPVAPAGTLCFAFNIVH
jgi:hypothetical protein